MFITSFDELTPRGAPGGGAVSGIGIVLSWNKSWNLLMNTFYGFPFETEHIHTRLKDSLSVFSISSVATNVACRPNDESAK